MKLLTLFAFLLLIASCKPGADDPKVHSLDSMQVELTELQRRLVATDTSEVKATYDTIAHYLQVIKSSIFDTLTEREASFMSSYYQIRKPFRDFGTSYKMFRDELEYTISQLEDLSRSIEHGNLAEDKKEEFYALEMSSAQQLHESLSEKLQSMEQLGDKFDSLHPLVTDYIKRVRIDSISGK